MYTNVWIVTFINPLNRQFVLGVYSTREKAVQAVERDADNSGEWLDRTWQNFSLNRGWASAYHDESMKERAGTYSITMRDLE